MTHKPSPDKVYKAISCLIDAYAYLAPDADRNNPTLLAGEMRRDGTYNLHDYARMLVSGMYDGLAYGNWSSEVKKP